MPRVGEDRKRVKVPRKEVTVEELAVVLRIADVREVVDDVEVDFEAILDAELRVACAHLGAAPSWA